MGMRDERQREFADTWINAGMFGILNLCPRFGKIYTSINIIEKFLPKTILVAYPKDKIKDSWQADFKKRGYDDSSVTYTTHLSLKKHLTEKYDLVIIDEIHLLSPAQVLAAQELFLLNKKILGLTGTLAAWTRRYLMNTLKLPVVATYSIATAIEEGVIADYEITVMSVDLDDRVIRTYGKKQMTERSRFRNFTFIIDKLEVEGKDTKFLRLSRVSVIQGSLAKVSKTKELLMKHKNERILVFCGLTKVADSLGIPSYHSKSTEKNVFDEFARGEGNQLAVIKIGETGVTYKPLNRVIINYFDSNSENMAQRINRCMSMEYDNPEKKAHIYIITSTEEAELNWLRRALEFFDTEKISYI